MKIIEEELAQAEAEALAAEGGEGGDDEEVMVMGMELDPFKLGDEASTFHGQGQEDDTKSVGGVSGLERELMGGATWDAFTICMALALTMDAEPVARENAFTIF